MPSIPRPITSHLVTPGRRAEPRLRSSHRRTKRRTPARASARWAAHRIFTALGVTAALCVGSLMATAAPALASRNNPVVTVSGHIDCGLESVDSVRYRADSGESGSADLSWSGLNRVLSKVAGRQIPGLDFVKVMTYSLTLNEVPKDGTHLYLSVNCSNVLGSSSFSTNFGVRRPLVGTKATRHICDPDIVELLGCIV